MQDIDLSNCEREPIHLLGSVQAFGCLFAFSTDWILVHVSDNCEAFTGRSPRDLTGLPATGFLDAEAIHAIRTRLQWLQLSDAVERLFRLDVFGDDRRFDVAVHLSGNQVVVEIEPSDETDRFDAVAVVRSMMSRLTKAGILDEFLSQAARQVRSVTGFDRVMVYRFLDDGAGEVVAESRADTMTESYLGLRYPASDIPPQARALYLRNLFRLIGDVNGKTAAIVPQHTPEGNLLDLSMSVLRSVSPIHLEYLRNMEVAASLSISIGVDGKLWGLFACHNPSPKIVNFDRRTAAELFSQMFSLELANRERDAVQVLEVQAREIHDRVMATMAVGGSIFGSLSDYLEQFTELISCDGVGVWIDGRYAAWGRGAQQEEMNDLARFLNRANVSRVYATDTLSKHYEKTGEFVTPIAGVLAIPVSRKPRDYLIFFRQEMAQSVNWAGNPDKAVEVGPNGSRLTPRKSFEIWRETVHDRSAPWSKAELRIAESLRITLLEIILRSIDENEMVRAQAQQQQDLLIRELNHRVRNILTLIRGLVTQTGEHATNIADFTDMLGGRVQALARAHDQLTEHNWAPSLFNRLVKNEISAYSSDWSERIELNGPPVLLDPQAFSTLALVVHEMVTNSAKYGALSEIRGRLKLSWSFDEAGSLAINWLEADGPPAKAPTRRGFGTTIIERSIPFELNGEAAIEYPPSGVSARFSVPARFAWLGDEDATLDEAEPLARLMPYQDNGNSVLIVEDNMIIAIDVEEMLHAMGFKDVVIASRVDEALAILENTKIDCAVLDINLGTETSIPVAERLVEMGVRFVFASGYGETGMLAEQFRDVSVLTKPYTLASLRAVLIR